MALLQRLLRGLSTVFAGADKRSVVVAVSVLVIVTLFVVPVSSHLLDLLIALNIGLALCVLVYAVMSENSSRLFSFAQLLLLTTFYRLALSVSSTRLILLRGDQGSDVAGRVIESFGTIVVKGDFIVGVVVFAVITIVNFVVIAKGSARVAEVAARFMLDSLPGKQLAIDSDLRAGTLTKEEAARKRVQLSQETQFFGSMDGAMKFVQGDAVAALIILFINSVGGVTIGMLRGMNFKDAVNTFGVLTIGDGLVHILPALLISVAAGVVVTQVSTVEASNSQHGGKSTSTGPLLPLAISAFVLVIFALLPGFPAFPFLVVSAICCGLAYLVVSNLEGGSPITGDVMLLDGTITSPRRISSLGFGGLLHAGNEGFSGSVLSIEQEIGLIRIAVDNSVLAKYLGLDGEPRVELMPYIRAVGEKLYADYGVVLPPPRFVISRDLPAGTFQVFVRDLLVTKQSISVSESFALTTEKIARLLAAESRKKGHHPLTHRPGVWVNYSSNSELAVDQLGIESLEAYQYIILVAYGAALEAIDDLFGLDEVKRVVLTLREQHEYLIDEIFSKNLLSYGECTELLRRLIKERVSIRDLKLIFEAVAEFGALNLTGQNDRREWLMNLHAYIRNALSRGIINSIVGDKEHLRVFTLSPEVEEEFREAMNSWEHSRARLPLEPEFEKTLRRNAERLLTPALERGITPLVILCSGDIRFGVQEFLMQHSYNAESVRAVAYEELRTQVSVEPVGALVV